MSNRIDLPVRPSNAVGLVAILPWLCLTVFSLILAYRYGVGFLILVPVAAAVAVHQWHLTGQLCLDRSVVRLTVRNDRLQVQRRDGKHYEAIADGESRLYPRLVILKLRPGDTTYKPLTVILWAETQTVGNVPADLHRQLRAWLRLGSSGGQAQRTN